MRVVPDAWPALVYEDWAEAKALLRPWIQIVGKIRTALSAPVSHWWRAPSILSRPVTSLPARE